MTAIAMFPGQSSRYPAMLERLIAEPACAAIVAEASQLLGRDLVAHFRGENGDAFASNRDVQVGVFLANHLHLRALADRGVDLAWSIGLSLGEYNHLVHIGALAFADALPLVDARGTLYDEARGGLMVSMFPIDATTVDEAIARLGVSDRVGVGLYNSPRQQVISGERDAVERVLAALEDDEFFDATVIEPRIPMHAPCFATTAQRFADIVAATPFSIPRLPYIPNARAAILVAPSADVIRGCLVDHVYRPVLWRASIDALAARVASPRFVEIGPRAVLHNMFGKDWMPGARAKSDTTDAHEWPAHIERLAEELRHAA